MCNKLFMVLSFFVVVTFGASKMYCASLWPENGRSSNPMDASLYSDPVASNVGDLITIVVNLSTAATKDQNTATTKDNSVNDAITSFMFPQYVPQNKGVLPTVNWSAARSFKGGGTVKNNETMVTTLQAKVIDVFPNGNMQVEAKRNYEVGTEKSTLVLTGVVRRQDLDSANSVSSIKVSDLQIKQEGVGPLSREQRKGWLTSFYEFISPF